jgi:hypothetical protein
VVEAGAWSWNDEKRRCVVGETVVMRRREKDIAGEVHQV